MPDDQTPDKPRHRHGTGHTAAYFAAERSVYESLVHYVGGAPFVGGGGYPLADLIQSSYHREIDSLLDDLAILGAAVVADDRETRRDAAADLVKRIDDVADRIRHQAAQPASTPDAATWSADYGDGGRPITGETTAVQARHLIDGDIPDAPVIEPDDSE